MTSTGMKILSRSKEHPHPSLTLFKTLGTQVQVENQYYQTYRPTGQITGKQNIDFKIENSSSTFINLNGIQIKVTCRLEQTADATGKVVAFTDSSFAYSQNSTLNALFKQAILKINNTVVSELSTTYHIKCFLKDVCFNSVTQTDRNALKMRYMFKDSCTTDEGLDTLDSANVNQVSINFFIPMVCNTRGKQKPFAIL